jgi:CRP-like cAMP-binding protein
MALKDDIAILSRVPVFAGLGEEHLRLLAFGAERLRVGDGQVLYRQGGPADCAFVVTRGQIRLSALNRNGSGEEPQGLAEPGAMLSELAMVMATERRFTATAIGDSEVLRVTRALFHRMVEEYPDVGRMVEARLRQKFSDMTASLAALADRFKS